MISRRSAITSGVGALGALAAGCFWERGTKVVYERARFSTRPASPTRTIALGLSYLGESGKRPIFVPSTYLPANPLPLVLMFHGSGGTAFDAVDSLRDWAEHFGFIVLAVDAKDGVWDAINDGFGDDILEADAALAAAFDHCAIASRRLSVAGFSDGATYAIGVGMANGDLFSRVAAFSPGYLLEVYHLGRPAFFVAHGLSDSVFPIDDTARVIVPALKKEYTVEYHEMPSGHSMSVAARDLAAPWLAAPR